MSAYWSYREFSLSARAGEEKRSELTVKPQEPFLISTFWFLGFNLQFTDPSSRHSFSFLFSSFVGWIKDPITSCLFSFLFHRVRLLGEDGKGEKEIDCWWV